MFHCFIDSDPDPINDGIVLYNEIEYPVNMAILCAFCTEFEKYYQKSQSNVIKITGKIKINTFKQFINASQKRPFFINMQNISEMKELAEIYGHRKLLKLLKDIETDEMDLKNVTTLNFASHIQVLSEQIRQQQILIESLMSKVNGKDIKRSSSQTVVKPEKIDFLKSEITKQVEERLKTLQTTIPKLEKTINFVKKPNRGIFYWLRQQVSEPLDRLKIVKVIPSSTSQFSSPAGDLIDGSRFVSWFSEDKRHQYIKIDFIDRIVQLDAYSLILSNSKREIWTPKSWKIEGSTDSIQWEIIDEQRNSQILGEETPMCCWRCKARQQYRYFKITQTEQNRNGSNFFMLGGIEFFGTICDRPKIFG